MDTTRHLYLDLESTVITPVVEGWFNVQLMNIEKVKAFIAEFKPHALHVFSFALHSEWDRDQFGMDARLRLEDRLGMKFSAVPTVHGEIIPACCKVLGLSPDVVTFNNLCAYWGKHEAFRLNMRHTWKGLVNWPDNEVEVVLLDDDVINESFTWPDLKIRGRVINVDTL